MITLNLLNVFNVILTEKEIKNKLFKILGVNVFRRNRKSSMCSLDIVKDGVTEKYQLVFSDHKNKKSIIVENLDKFPDKEKALAFVINKSFEEPLKSILIK